MSVPDFIIKIPIDLLFILHIAKNIAYHITEVLTFYAELQILMLMGSSKNLYVFNFAILLKSRKFDAREIYVFYSKNALNGSCNV